MPGKRAVVAAAKVVRDPLYTLSQLAVRWGWSQQKLQRLVDAKAIPHFRLVGRRNNDIHFLESEVDAWLQTRRVPVATDEEAQIAGEMDRATECHRLGIPTEHEFSP